MHVCYPNAVCWHFFFRSAKTVFAHLASSKLANRIPIELVASISDEMMIEIDCGSLITAVEKCPLIWVAACSDHKDRRQKVQQNKKNL